MYIATCGHRIQDGISCSIDDGQLSSSGGRLITYGTYCAKCLFEYYQSGDIENKEMEEFIALLIEDAEIR